MLFGGGGCTCHLHCAQLCCDLHQRSWQLPVTATCVGLPDGAANRVSVVMAMYSLSYFMVSVCLVDIYASVSIAATSLLTLVMCVHQVCLHCMR
jgi:hypothetical protein